MRALAVLICLMLTTACSRGDDVRLDPTKLTFELAVRLDRETGARITGQPGAAPHGATIACRLAADHDWRLGEGEAGADGAFTIELDGRPWPRETLSPDAFDTLNESIECRAEDGPWVHPLRQPRVVVE